MSEIVYGVHVVRWPDQSFIEPGNPMPGWEPNNWPEERAKLIAATGNRFTEDGEDFFWPKHDQWFKTKASAQKRVDLLNKYGANAVVKIGRFEWKNLDGTELNWDEDEAQFADPEVTA